MRKLLLAMMLGSFVLGCDDTSTDTGTGGNAATSSTGSTATTTGTTSGSTGATGTSSSTGSAMAASCATYKFCEDFEKGNPGETPPGWTEHAGWDQSGSRAVLTADEKHGGAQSLKSAVGTNGQYRIERDLKSLGDLASHHWGRIFYKVKTPVALDGMYVHNTFVAFGRPSTANGSESRLVDTVVDPQGKHQFLINVPDDSCCAGSSYDYQYDANWHCAEWYVDGAAASFQFFYDGAEVKDIALTNEPNAHIADFQSVIVGWIKLPVAEHTERRLVRRSRAPRRAHRLQLTGPDRDRATRATV